MHRTGIEPISTALKAAMLPLRRFTIEEMNFRFFKHGFFLTNILSVTSSKNQNESLQLESLLCYHYANDAENVYDRRDEFQIFQIWFFKFGFFLTNILSATSSKNQNESLQLERLLCYHYANDAEKVYDRRDEFQIFQIWFFYKYSECHIKKNQNYSLRSGVVFSLTRLI